jgi:hypothetical protein
MTMRDGDVFTEPVDGNARVDIVTQYTITNAHAFTMKGCNTIEIV